MQGGIFLQPSGNCRTRTRHRMMDNAERASAGGSELVAKSRDGRGGVAAWMIVSSASEQMSQLHVT